MGDSTIGKNLLELREEHKWTQDDLAKITGIGPKYISALERGKRVPGAKILDKLCNAFGVTESELRFGSDVIPPSHLFSEPIMRIAAELSLLSESEQYAELADILRRKEEKRL
jgi:transcriptional regulator with XRE-family HTH domain